METYSRDEWRIYKHVGKWDDVIEGPDTNGLMVVPSFRAELAEAEVERLRESLRLIASCERHHENDVVDIARKALA